MAPASTSATGRAAAAPHLPSRANSPGRSPESTMPGRRYGASGCVTPSISPVTAPTAAPIPAPQSQPAPMHRNSSTASTGEIPHGASCRNPVSTPASRSERLMISSGDKSSRSCRRTRRAVAYMRESTIAVSPPAAAMMWS